MECLNDTEEMELISGPWRATRLWNRIVYDFLKRMPCKRHTRKMKTYDQCFTASEAVEWLYKRLQKNPNFSDGALSRDKALGLLQKFVKAQIIEPVACEFFDPDEHLLKEGPELYRFTASSFDLDLRTPGRKSPRKKLDLSRPAFHDVANTPSRPRSRMSVRSMVWNKKSHFDETQSEPGGPKRRAKSEENNLTDEKKRELNRQAIESLPMDSLVVLDNDGSWKTAFVRNLEANLSVAHVRRININVANITYNMTKTGTRGVVQLDQEMKSQDLPNWVLSAMKCLAHWPRQPSRGSQDPIQSYPTFVEDVFSTIKDYFESLRSPLTTFEMFDFFVSAFVKAEAVGAKHRLAPYPSVVPLPKPSYMETDLDSMTTSTPQTSATSEPFYTMHESSTTDFRTREGRAAVRQTQPANQWRPTSTAVMRNLLPPNSCFETAFMDESPITGIVPQKANDSLHLRSSFRSVTGYSPPSLTGWETRSTATQTSETEKKVPKWKRASRFRKSIAVVDDRELIQRNNTFANMQPDPYVHTSRTNLYQCSTSALPSARPPPQIRGFSSLDNLLDAHLDAPRRLSTPLDDPFLHKYNKYTEANKTDDPRRPLRADNVIKSNSVRKEGRKQRDRKEKSVDRLDGVTSRVDYVTSQFHGLTVKTPILPDMQYAHNQAYAHHAVPYQQSNLPDYFAISANQTFGSIASSSEGNSTNSHESSWLGKEGTESAVKSFNLLGLLLPPPNRRKLQLLLKFMNRVATNGQLTLAATERDRTRTRRDVVLDTFTPFILSPADLVNGDEETSRRIVEFFLDHYDQIWLPSETLRRDVEDLVFENLAKKRKIEGEDPHPITFCERVSKDAYEKDKDANFTAAMLDLLEQYLIQKMSAKERKKKIQRFKEMYPEIYRQRFPTEMDEPKCMKSTTKYPSLTRLRNAVGI